LTLVVCMVALVGGLGIPWSVSSIHSQSGPVTSTYEFDPVTSRVTLHLTLNDSPLAPITSVFIKLPGAQSLLQGPPGWTGSPSGSDYFAACAGSDCSSSGATGQPLVGHAALEW
jgi:hypothetical protein